MFWLGLVRFPLGFH